MQRLADTFEGAVGEIVEMVSSAATELEASSNTLTQAAERGNGLATAVATAGGGVRQCAIRVAHSRHSTQ